MSSRAGALILRKHAWCWFIPAGRPRVTRCPAAIPHPRCRYTTAIPTEHGILGGLTKALAEKLKKDAIVITTDYRLGQGFSLLESIEGDNPGVGGEKADGRGVKGPRACAIRPSVCRTPRKVHPSSWGYGLWPFARPHGLVVAAAHSPPHPLPHPAPPLARLAPNQLRGCCPI